jgi:hypothetical protein
LQAGTSASKEHTANIFSAELDKFVQVVNMFILLEMCPVRISVQTAADDDCKVNTDAVSPDVTGLAPF